MRLALGVDRPGSTGDQLHRFDRVVRLGEMGGNLPPGVTGRANYLAAS